MIIIDIFQTPLQDQLLNCMGMMMEVGQTDVQDVSQIIFGGRNRITQRKPTDLSQVTDKLYHIMLYVYETLQQ
jgi:hypothetical protein